MGDTFGGGIREDRRHRVCGAGVSYKRGDAVLVWKSGTALLIHGIWNFVSFYIIVMFSRPLQCNVRLLS